MQPFLVSPVQIAFDEDNKIIYSCSWRLVSGVENISDPAAAAREWAGRAGEAFRLPGPDGTDYIEAPGIVVSSISVEPAGDPATFTVAYTGIEKRGEDEQELPLIGISESISRNGERSKSARFRMRSTCVKDFLPAIGSPLDWAGDAFVCESVELKELVSGEFELSVSAREITAIPLGNVARNVSRDSEETATVSFFVGNAAFKDFVSGLKPGSAAEWAGERYCLSEYSSSPYGRIGHQVNCSARKVETRMVHCTRSERFAGFDRSDCPTREIIYNSSWLIHADDLESYRLITGTAAGWIDDDTIITSVSPSRISPVEYRLEIEAKQVDSPSLLQSNDNDDDRSDLAGRVDVDCCLTEFMMNSAQCGYYDDGEGRFEKIEGFVTEKSCPLIKNSGEIDEHYIDMVLKTVQITETRYLRGSANHNLRELIEFGSSHVYNGNVAGHPGSFMRVDIDASEVRDNRNALFTRVTRVFQLAPSGFVWNAAYWN